MPLSANAKPLKVEPFEEYMLVDDRPAFPMSFFVRLRFSGCVDDVVLRKAARSAIDRHPMLASVISDQRGRRLFWTSADLDENGIPLDAAAEDDKFPPAPWLNIRETAGLRIQVLLGTDRSDVILHLHHACCDALGAYQFASDLLVAYANEIAGKGDATELPSNNAARLADRTRFDMTTWKWLKLAPRQLRGLFGARQFLMRKPVPIVPHDPVLDEIEPHPRYPTVVVHCFDRTETEDIVAMSKQQGVSVNDVLARDLFLALNDFRGRAGTGNDGDWLRLTIPISLRDYDDVQTSAANVLSMVFLDRQPRDCGDRQRLLNTIHDEMSLIKRYRLGFTFLWSLRLASALPGGIARANRNVKCLGTTVLSNVVRPLDKCPLPRYDGHIVAGNLLLKQTEFLPPFRPYTCAAFSITTYGGRMVMALHYDPSVLNGDQARHLMDTYVGFVRQSIQPT